MDEKARKIFHKAESELTEYERMMLSILAEKETAEAPQAEGSADLSVSEETSDEPESEAVPSEEAITPEDAASENDEIPADVPESETDEPIAEAGEPEAAEPAADEVVPEEPVAESPFDETDDSDMKLAPDPAEEKKHEPIPLLTVEKNPELEPVVLSQPTIQFMNSIEREKKITQKIRRQRRRSGIVVLALCVALILVAFLYNGIVNESWGFLDKEEATPEPTVEVVAVVVTPSPTPSPTPEPVKEHSYAMELANLSWTGAQDLCLASGGYLAVISSKAEFDRITAMADEKGIERLWIGCHRENNTYIWENGETSDYYVWGNGEPSYIDTGDGAAEDYIMLWKLDGVWCYNDSRNDPAGEFWGWRGTIGYVCEFEE